MANNIDLTATFDTTDAIKSVNKFGTEATKSINGVNKSVDTLQKNVDETSKRKFNIDTNQAKDAIAGLTKSMIALGAAYVSISAVKNFFGDSIRAAMAQETAVNQLNQALARTGPLTQERSKDFQDFASSLQRVSTIGDEVSLEMLSIARNFTQTDEQAKKLVKTAADMSAAMGISLDAAVRQLGKTFGGMKGELGEVLPEIKNLTAEQLKAGAAIDVLAAKFAGAATGQINTFEGAITQLKNAFGDFQESIGAAITQNPVIIQAIKELSNYFSNTTDQIKDGTGAMIDFVNRGLLAVLSGVRDMLPSLNTLLSSIKSVFFVVTSLTKSFSILANLTEAVGMAIAVLAGNMAKFSAGKAIQENIAKIKQDVIDLENAFKGIVGPVISDEDLLKMDAAIARIQARAKDGINVDVKPNVALPKDLKTTIGADIKAGDIKAPDLEKVFGENISKEFQDYLDFMAPFSEAGDKLANFIESSKGFDEQDWEDFFKQLKETPRTFGETLKYFVRGAIGELPEKVKSSLADMASNMLIGIGEVFYYLKKNAEPLVKSSFAAISGAISAVAQGAEGAKKYVPEMLSNIMQGVGGAVGSIWGPVGSAIGSGIGSIFGEQIKLASLPREEIEKKITEFFDEIPKVINRILDNLPMIAEKMGDNLPGMFLRIFEAIPYILEASVKVMEGIGESAALDNQAWAALLPEIFVAIWTSAALGVKYFVQGFARGAERYFTEKGAEIVRVTSEKFNAIGDAIGNIFTGIRNFIKKISFENFFKGFGTLLAGILNKWTNFLDGVEKLGGFLSSGFKGLLDLISNTFGNLGTQISESVSNFFAQFGITIDSISGGLDYYAKQIPKKIESFFQNIIDGLKSYYTGIFDAIVNLFNSISNAVYEAGKNLLDGLVPGIKEKLSEFGLNLSGGLSSFGTKVANTLRDSVGQFFSGDKLGEMFNAIKDGLTDIFKKIDPTKIIGAITGGGGGGGQGLIPNSVPIIGALATGGVVPAGYPDDSYPALLTSGEVVVPAATTPNLFSLIDRLASGTAQTTDNTAQNQTNELLRQLINMIGSQQQVIEVRLDRDTLARAIVALNKDNRRLA